MRTSAALARAIIVLVVAGSCTSGPGPSEGGSSSTTAPEVAAETVPVPQVFDSEPIVVVGPAGSGQDSGTIEDALGAFAADSGIAIEYIEQRDVDRAFEQSFGAEVTGDIFIIESTDLLIEGAIEREIRPIPRVVDAAIGRAWSGAWTMPARIGELLYGVPLDARVESLIWYQPARFESAGLDVPTTWTGMVETAEAMVELELTPFCGFGDQAEHTEAFVDWTFDLFVRSYEPSAYDNLLADNGQLDFDHIDVFEIWKQVRDLWQLPGVGFHVAADVDGAEEGLTAAEALVAGDCMMLRSGPDIVGELPAGTPFGDGTQAAVDLSVFPGPRGNIPVIADVTYAVSRKDSDAAWAVMQYLGGSDFARLRHSSQADSTDPVPGFLSVAADQDLFQLSLLELSLLDLAAQATEVREPWDDVVPQWRKLVTISAARNLLAERGPITDALAEIAGS